MEAGLEKIRSGTFAREWAALSALQDAARRLRLHELEQELRRAVRYNPPLQPGD